MAKDPLTPPRPGDRNAADGLGHRLGTSVHMCPGSRRGTTVGVEQTCQNKNSKPQARLLNLSLRLERSAIRMYFPDKKNKRFTAAILITSILLSPLLTIIPL